MRVLSTPGRGFRWVRYSRTGRRLLGHDRFSPTWWEWDLASGAEGVKLKPNDPRPNHCRFLATPHGEAFLRAHGYWPDSEEWPGGELRPEHGRVAEWVKGLFAWLCFTHDGRGALRTLAGPYHRTPDQLAVWGFDEQIQRRFALEDPIWPPKRASFSSDGRLVALAFYTHLEVREASTDKVLIQTTKGGQKLQQHALSPDDNWAAIAAGRIVSTVDVRKRLMAHRFPAFKATVEALAYSPDSRLLAAGSREGRVRLWEVQSGRELADLALRKSDVEHLAFSPDGQTLAVACKDKCVVILDVDV